MQNLEDIIKKSLKRNAGTLKRSPGCSGEAELAKYLEGALPSGKRLDIERHLSDCSYCLDLLVAARELLKDVPGNKASWFNKLKAQKWLLLTTISFAFSFAVKRYFLQFLFLALILGIKWALGNEGSRNLVMIFRSLSRNEDKSGRPEEKIFERK